MQIGQKKTTGQKMKKERNRGRETDRKPNISQIQKTGEHCIYAKRCGGCDYQGILYSQQLSKKQSYMRKLMEPFGKINPIIGMDDPYHYRHKVQAAFSCNKRGHIVAGVYEKHSHDIVDVEQCQIEDAQADAIIREIKNMMRSFRIRAYDEDTGYGLLRHVLVRKGYHSGQIMVVLVLVSPILPSKNNFVKALRKKFPEISTVVLNVNERKTSMVLGARNITLYGKGYIEDVLCGLRFRISSRSFYQINSVQTEKLYGKAMELAELTGKETVLDAYCGIGTIGLIASKHAGKVIGVELNQDAVRDAVQNAKKNGITNAQFFCNDAGRFMSHMAARGESADVVFMDPPRSGSTEEFIDAVALMQPKRVVYISCGPDTLARDLKVFAKHGYRAKEAWPVDLFGWTGHVETVTLLTRKAR